VAEAAAELPLIMPEDVTPAEELRRPSSKQLHMVSPDAEAPAPAEEAPDEPMVTETMGDLYLGQGLKEKAADVYRRLLALRPDDAGIRAKLAAIEAPPAMSASASGSEPVGSWLRRIAKAQLTVGAPAPMPAPETGPSPMEQAFTAPEPAPEPVVPAAASVPVESGAPGQPARQATDQFSLDQLFGSGRSAPTSPAASPDPHTLGSSFDEFFGSSPKPETVRPKEGGTGRQSEDDLGAFNAWLHGLKR
jgi:hypothetical protein